MKLLALQVRGPPRHASRALAAGRDTAACEVQHHVWTKAQNVDQSMGGPVFCERGVYLFFVKEGEPANVFVVSHIGGPFEGGRVSSHHNSWSHIQHCIY